MAALAWVAATTSPRSSAHMQEQWCCPQLGLVALITTLWMFNTAQGEGLLFPAALVDTVVFSYPGPPYDGALIGSALHDQAVSRLSLTSGSGTQPRRRSMAPLFGGKGPIGALGARSRQILDCYGRRPISCDGRSRTDSGGVQRPRYTRTQLEHP